MKVILDSSNTVMLTTTETTEIVREVEALVRQGLVTNGILFELAIALSNPYNQAWSK